MASLDKFKNKTATLWRLRFTFGNKSRTMYLPNVNKRTAQTIQRHVEEFIRADKLGMQPDPDSVVWAGSVDQKIRDKLIEFGLLGQTKSMTYANCTGIGEFLDAYLTSRTDLATNSHENYDQTRKKLKLFFGESHPIRSITVADATRFRNWLAVQVVKEATADSPAKTMAAATLSKHIKRAKTMFQAAADDGMFVASPFAQQQGCTESNRERFFFVTREMYQQVLEACPDYDWKLILALPRLAGLRCPSEVAQLRWEDINWDEKKIRIKAKKTKERFCPLFPELSGLLLAAMEQSNQDFCIGYHRHSENLSTHMKRIIRRAGVEPWPKTFVNLRSTRRTELQETFPAHVLDEWFGHSERVASEHYLQVTQGHWDAGVNFEEGK